MIERMKKVFIVASEGRKDEMIASLRDLGLVHLSDRVSADAKSTERFSQLSFTISTIKDYEEKGQKQEKLLSDEEFAELDKKVTEAIDSRTAAISNRSAAMLEAEKISKWGDFDPEMVLNLRRYSMIFRFYSIADKELAALAANEDVKYIKLATVDKMNTIAVLGSDDIPVSATEFQLPAKGLSALKKEIEECDRIIENSTNVLKAAAGNLNSYNDQLVKAQNVLEVSSVSRTAESEDGLVWLTGYVPTADAQIFEDAAKKNGWAYAMEDVIEDDSKVPSKVKYNKLTSLMIPVFDILGTVPGYNEYDISFWFLGFFTLFVAMILGDAGYGMLMLIAAIVLSIKLKKTPNALLLLYVLSIATVIWGSVTGTWFGLEQAMNVPFLKALVIPNIANYPEYFGVTTTQAQNAVMKFCFSIGAVQLALACIMNVKKKIPQKDLSFVADIGWLCSICALYFLTLFLVIGETVNVTMVAVVVIIGFILVVTFGGMAPGVSFGDGLKAGLGGAFTAFLNTISAFGNVMSYIRLFAVGMASLAIAQSFNNMAFGFSGPLIVIGAVIMIIGHALNIVMGLLSVAVHGIRLNLLEFSGQLGMEWSGIAYDPFRKLDKIRK